LDACDDFTPQGCVEEDAFNIKAQGGMQGFAD
jgi:hypothetical protein